MRTGARRATMGGHHGKGIRHPRPPRIQSHRYRQSVARRRRSRESPGGDHRAQGAGSGKQARRRNGQSLGRECASMNLAGAFTRYFPNSRGTRVSELGAWCAPRAGSRALISLVVPVAGRCGAHARVAWRRPTSVDHDARKRGNSLFFSGVRLENLYLLVDVPNTSGYSQNNTKA